MMTTAKCQMQDKAGILEGRPQPVILSHRTRFTFVISHWINPRLKRFIKQRIKLLTLSRATKTLSDKALLKEEVKSDIPLKAGDMVRIRSSDEIKASLDSHGRLKGCGFMPEMEPYCNTVQRVFKPVERFLDEYDYTVRKVKGIVLLESLYCLGVAGAGRCDRSCFYFWRVEWLEYLDERECNPI
jgi:hypothetical protein